MVKIFLIYCSVCLAVGAFEIPASRWAREVASGWKGKWFPNAPGAVDENEVVDYGRYRGKVDDGPDHGAPMGEVNSLCDDAVVNLTTDWDGSSLNYTCFQNKGKFLPDPDVHPILHCDHIPMQYHAQHVCMNTSLEYDDLIPTFGPHRPLWAKYGEYLFLPKQRWLHNLEHGAVVMLYHPCANKNEVALLKHLVQRCLYRHIITPYNLLPANRPLALVTWGCRFMMSKVDIKLVVEYIKRTALQGSEFLSKDGQYDFSLVKPATIVSDMEDSFLCPNII